MKVRRQCSRNACTRPAVATLTYDYADSTAVLGPLATTAEPHAYDLCDQHAENLTVPRGWQVVRLAEHFDPAPPTEDDLVALADAVREASHRRPAARRAERPARAPITHELPDSEAMRRTNFTVITGGIEDD